MSLSGTVLKGQWRLGKLLGAGACAQVYEATDVKGAASSAQAYVAKVCTLPTNVAALSTAGKKRKKTLQEKQADTLFYEYTCYNGFLRGHDSVPALPVGCYGDDTASGLRFLVMQVCNELANQTSCVQLRGSVLIAISLDTPCKLCSLQRLGPDMEVAFNAQGSSWSSSTIAAYGRHMLHALSALHTAHKMVFVDVKPDNFAFGMPGTACADKIFLLDFGLSERYTGAGGVHKLQVSKHVFGYCSCHCLCTLAALFVSAHLM
jgi:serine/threonine protein kinase